MATRIENITKLCDRPEKTLRRSFIFLLWMDYSMANVLPIHYGIHRRWLQIHNDCASLSVSHSNRFQFLGPKSRNILSKQPKELYILSQNPNSPVEYHDGHPAVGSFEAHEYQVPLVVDQG